jgi:hypothetical protein
MRVPGPRPLAVAATVLALLVACADSGATATRSGSRPPHPLVLLEAASEDVIDQVPQGRWTRVDRVVADMQDVWRRYRATVTGEAPGLGARLDRAVPAMAAAAGTRDGLGTEQAANDLSAAVVELLGRGSAAPPVQVGRLDVIGRQVVIDVARARFAAARRSAATAATQWSTIRADARARDRRVARAVDRAIARLQAHAGVGDGLATRNDSNDLLELVDALERLY